VARSRWPISPAALVSLVIAHSVGALLLGALGSAFMLHLPDGSGPVLQLSPDRVALLASGEGKLAAILDRDPEQRLRSCVHHFRGQVLGPESIAIAANGSLLALDRTGNLHRADADATGGYTLASGVAFVGPGRPLGSEAHGRHLLIADSLKGLLELDLETSGLSILSNRLAYANDLAIDHTDRFDGLDLNNHNEDTTLGTDKYGRVFFTSSTREPVEVARTPSGAFYDTMNGYMRTMLRAAIALRRLGLDGGIDLPTIMRAYWDIVPEEFDLTVEAFKMRRFQASFQHAGLSARIGMASPYDGLCSTRVLVMTRLRGTRMLDIVREARETRGGLPCPAEVVRVHGGWAGLVHSLHLAWGRMVLVEGVFHTDPHPGNLLILNDGRLGILDWGQTKRLRPEHVLLMCRMTLAMAGERYAQIESLIEGSGEFALEELEGRSALERRMAWVRARERESPAPPCPLPPLRPVARTR
jgi:hypothetical protein